MAENVGGIVWTASIETQQLVNGERAIQRSTRAGEKGFNRLDQSVQRTNQSMMTMSRIARSVISVIAIRQITSYADAFTNVQNRLKIVTDSSEQLADVTQKVSDIARASHSNLESTAILYSRLARSTDELGISQERMLAITETITKSFTLSGATAQEASNAIRQLSQGFAAGALRGEEFNSVAEQAPEILRAVSKETGMSVGALREFAAEGGITSELLIRSLENYADEVEKAFGDITTTMGQAMEDARTNIIEYVGALNNSLGVTDKAGSAVVVLSENVDKLVTALGAVAAVYAGRMVNSIGAATAAKINTTKATIASTGAELSAAKAASTKAQADLAAIRVAQQRTAGFVLNKQAMDALTAAEARATKTTAALTAAQANYNRVASVGAVAARGLSAAMALLGGPAGVILLAAGALTYFAVQQSKVQTEAEKTNQSLREMAGTFDTLSQAQARETEFKLAKQLGDAWREGRRLKEELERVEKARPLDFGGARGNAVREYRKNVEELTEAIAANEEEAALLESLMAKLAQRQLDAADAAREHQKELDEKAYQEVTQAIEDQIFAIRNGQQAYDIMVAQRKANVDAMSDEGKAIAESIRQRDKEQESLDARTEAEKRAEDALQDAKDSYEEYAEAIKAGNLELKGTEATRAAMLQDIRSTGEAAGKSESDIRALIAAQKELWEAQDQAAADEETGSKLANLSEEIRLLEIKNALGNEEYEREAAIAALGPDASDEDIEKISSLITQLQDARFEAQLLGETLETSFRDIGLNALDDLSSGLARAITEGDSLSDTIHGISKTILTELLGAIIRYWAGQAAAAIFGQKAAAGAAIVGAGAATAAWTAPATLASIATLGGAAGIGVAAVQGALATSQGLTALSGGGAAGAMFGGARQYGGPAEPGKAYRVNETEPEMFISGGHQYLMPNMRGEVMNSKQVGGGDVKVSVQVNNNSPGVDVGVRQQGIGNDRQFILDVVKADITGYGQSTVGALTTVTNIKRKTQ